MDEPRSWVLAADTIVHQATTSSSRWMTAMLSRCFSVSRATGRVTTAWCLRWTGPGASATGRRLMRGRTTSRVCFRDLQPKEIARYVATGEGRDKAGSYAVRVRASLIDRVVEAPPMSWVYPSARSSPPYSKPELPDEHRR